jgi:hypothetical protein
VVRSHKLWARNGTVLITLSGWYFLALGLVRMFAASQYLQAIHGASSMAFMALERFRLVIALTITFKAYSSTTA